MQIETYLSAMYTSSKPCSPTLGLETSKLQLPDFFPFDFPEGLPMGGSGEVGRGQGDSISCWLWVVLGAKSEVCTVCGVHSIRYVQCEVCSVRCAQCVVCTVCGVHSAWCVQCEVWLEALAEAWALEVVASLWLLIQPFPDLFNQFLRLTYLCLKHLEWFVFLIGKEWILKNARILFYWTCLYSQGIISF